MHTVLNAICLQLCTVISTDYESKVSYYSFMLELLHRVASGLAHVHRLRDSAYTCVEPTDILR